MSVSILVVDDEPDVVDLFRQRFRREVRDGTYVMHFANSGETALGQLNNGIEPTLIVILSDINMPGMDGLALLQAIKQQWPEIPVMMSCCSVAMPSKRWELLTLRSEPIQLQIPRPIGWPFFLSFWAHCDRPKPS